MSQATLDGLVLTFTVGSATLGGIILVAIAISGWKSYVLPTLFGLIAATLLEPQVHRMMAQPSSAASLSLVLLLGPAISLVIRLVVEAPLRRYSLDRAHLSSVLVPARWSIIGEHGEDTARDQVKRCFVTIAAAAGAVVGSVVGLDLFWTALHEAIEPRSILFAFLLVGISMFLTGPIQAYIFDLGMGVKQSAEPSKKLTDLFANGVDWRAAGRFGLVLLAFVQLYLLTSCIGTAIKQGSVRVLITIVTAALTPAIVSYYWSAALQRRAPSVRRFVFRPSLYLGAIMNYGFALMLVTGLYLAVLEWLNEGSGKPVPTALLIVFIIIPVIAILPALLISAIGTALYAFAGGYVIDRFSGQSAMLFLAIALSLAAMVHVSFNTMALWIVGADQVRYGTFVGALYGWLAGLWASGFPRLLTTERRKSGLISPASG